jgi:hypothetical protein
MRLLTLKQSWLTYGLEGAAYGLCLTVLGWLIAGFGHGSYLPIGVAASPLSLVEVRIALFAPVLVWALLGILLYNARHGCKRTFLFAIVLHYLGNISLFAIEPYSELESLHRSIESLGIFVSLFALVYTLGQIIMWHNFLKSSRAQSIG